MKLKTFFLTLAVVFNDLKGLVHLEKLITDNYRYPEKEETTIHAGEYGGMLVHVQKLFIGTIQEFFKFLSSNESIILRGELQFLLNKMPKQIQERWDIIMDIACGKNPKMTNFTTTLIKIRNNLSFHYNQSGKILREAFIKRFFHKTKKEQNKSAYYSIGDNMEQTRFYFADASQQQFLVTMSYEVEGSESEDVLVISQNYAKTILSIINDMNFAIMTLLKTYLKERPYRN